MYLEPPFDASEASPNDRRTALPEQLERFARAAQRAFSDNTERALRVRSLHLCRVVRGARGTDAAGRAGNRRRLRRRDGGDPCAGDGPPLCRQHRRGPPGRWGWRRPSRALLVGLALKRMHRTERGAARTRHTR